MTTPNGERSVVTLIYVPQLDWMIGYNQPLNGIQAKVKKATYPVLWILALVLLTVPLQGALFSRYVVQPYAVKPLEQAVHAERAEADALLDAVADGIVVISPDYKVLRTNRSMQRIYGDKVGQTCYEAFFCAAAECPECPSRAVFQTGQPGRVIRQVNMPDGGARWMETIAAPLHNDRGSVVASIEVIRDITERRKLEERLAQSARLRALGELAAGIAHEIGTPMTAVLTFLSMVQRDAERNGVPERMKQRLRLIREQTERVVRITQRILTFAKHRAPLIERLDVNEVLEKTLELLRPQLQSQKIQVDDADAARPTRTGAGTEAPPLRASQSDATDASSDRVRVIANADELHEVFLNLIINAQDAMPAGGRLTVRTQTEEGVVRVEITDTGVGIPPENLSKIFEPGFSTKADEGVAKGLGLGLFLSQGIIESFGGSLEVESEVGKGTTFTVRLPIA